MNGRKLLAAIIVSFFLTPSVGKIHACSMYKITADGKTMVGYNHDAWKITASIWFENARNKNEYGACITGSREIGLNKFAPASGMNEAGLTFSTLASYHPIKDMNGIEKRQIANKADYLIDILHKCKTVEDVRRYVERYDHSIFIEQVFLYIDITGDYLIVEPYQMIKGNDPTYVLANFCPSITSKHDARRMKRYRDGEDYLSLNKPESSLDYCRTLSDTMSVCRKRNGDGTLLTTIWDTHNGFVNLYFYHDYDTTVQFNISEELALGDHAIIIPDIFPVNPEFQRLKAYKTPVTTSSLFFCLAFIGCVILVLSLMFVISFLRRKNVDKYNLIKLLFTGMNIILFAYLFILSKNISIYYFDAPYQHYSSDIISLSSYTPLLLLLVIAPISFLSFRFLMSNTKSFIIKSSLIINNAIYFLLLLGFGYWGLFDILN